MKTNLEFKCKKIEKLFIIIIIIKLVTILKTLFI